MALIDLWKKDKSHLTEKNLRQVIAFAGDGKLTDGTSGSEELRAFLRHIPTALLTKYVEECLSDSFDGSGFALQDLVNEVGRRLGYEVVHGRYRGSSKHLGHDGIWKDGSQHSIVIEVKTTDAYRIDLDTVAGYRQQLAKTGTLDLSRSSMLIVVGRQDTGDLEAQIRGSRHAWDMRVISVEAVLRMLRLREDVEDPYLVKRIHGILVPCEFTRLDPIVEIAFAAVQDVKEESQVGEDDSEEEDKKFVPSAFHDDCVARVESCLKINLVKRSRATFSSADDSIRIICAVSRFHERHYRFWFGFHPHQEQYLAEASGKAFAVFGCGDAQTVIAIPFDVFQPWLANCGITERGDRFYWHIKIRQDNDRYWLTGRAKTQDFEITRFKT